MQKQHKVLPHKYSAEQSRQDFVKSFKFYLATKIAPGNKLTYELNAKPRFNKEHGREPSCRRDVDVVMKEEPFYQLWGLLQRSSQEMMWKSCQIPVKRQWDELNHNAIVENNNSGSLALDPNLKTPSYLSSVDIHCQPGGYDWEQTKDDVAAGAVYDQGVYIYAMGRLGDLNDDMGMSQATYIKNKFSNIKPKRILDIGCTVGHSTLPYKVLFPDAEVYGIDVAAPVLRYAHARAESLDQSIHFSQQNAEKTNFDDESFDLIVSHILLHETSSKAIKNIMTECHRLLKKDGWMVHSETPPYANMDPFESFILDWDAKHNNEPFWSLSHEIDPKNISRECNFKDETVFETMIPSVFEINQSKRTNLFQGGDFGGSGMWYIFGMQK